MNDSEIIGRIENKLNAGPVESRARCEFNVDCPDCGVIAHCNFTSPGLYRGFDHYGPKHHMICPDCDQEWTQEDSITHRIFRDAKEEAQKASDIANGYHKEMED